VSNITAKIGWFYSLGSELRQNDRIVRLAPITPLRVDEIHIRETVCYPVSVPNRDETDVPKSANELECHSIENEMSVDCSSIIPSLLMVV
jgi:hypothetical protein